MNKINIAFFGTPDFSVPCLDLLANHPLVNLKFIISMPDRPAGRGLELKSPPVIEYAKNNKISFFQTKNINLETSFIEELKASEIDVFIVLAFAQFLSEAVLGIPKIGAFNIHTSLLPKYRGAAPIHWAILNGDSETGVCIQKMVKKMDAGDVVIQKNIAIYDYETGGMLYTKLKYQSVEVLTLFLNLVLNKKLKFSSQDSTLISFAPEIKNEDALLDFKNHTSNNILNKIRAFNPHPGAYFFLNNKRLKIFYAEKFNHSIPPGSIKNDLGRLIIGCSDGSLHLKEVQYEGKKRSSDHDLLNGLRDKLDLTSPKDFK